MRAVCCLVLLWGGCRPDHAVTPDLDAAPTNDAPTPSLAPSAEPTDAATGAQVPRETTITLAFGGDIIPHRHVLEVPVEPWFRDLPAFWQRADARVFNLEAPIGGRERLEGGLALAAPRDWFAAVLKASNPTAVVATNNHICDLGPEGVAETARQAKELHIPLVGLSSEDAWAPQTLLEKDGKKVCLFAWTAFLNDAGPNVSNSKARGCIKGEAGARIAYAPLGSWGEKVIDKAFGDGTRVAGCDARIAYVHAGNEYRVQNGYALAQAKVAAKYMDAIVFSHPHVPDVISTIARPSADGGAPRGVVVFHSLGNFVSNQGADWVLGKSGGGISFKRGQPDQGETAWTRVAMLAHLRLRWAQDADPRDFSVDYGMQLAFTERQPDELSLRLFPAEGDDPVAERLRRGAPPFAGLIDDPCRVSASSDAPCAVQLPTAANTTHGTTTKP